MNKLIELPKKEQVQYFIEATARSPNIKLPIIMEKDFWVCWILEKIFSNNELSTNITFKGGTSLSKCYGIINRFSEDCDLTVSKKFIGINDDNDPIFAVTSSQRNKSLAKLADAAKKIVSHTIKPLLTKIIHKNLSENFDTNEWSLETDYSDEQTLIFHYPSHFEKLTNAYILSSIKLEFGARGDTSPVESKKISPYIVQALPEIFDTPESIQVNVLAAKRTFWEKITLLHTEYHRDPQKPMPNRLFRHYYDIVMLDKNGITELALQDTSLLDNVIKNKSIYFPSKWANYESAKIGNLRLSPHKNFLNLLKQDSQRMSEMFFGEQPTFENIMSKIAEIETVINH